MNIKSIVSVITLVTTLMLNAQEHIYTSFSIPEHLKKNANAVIRSNIVTIQIHSQFDMDVTEKRIITVLNKEGDKNVDAYIGYDKGIKIKDLEALIFDSLGKEIKKIKKNDFKDVSAVDGISLYTDDRFKYLEYTPISYPYNVVFTNSFNTNTTAFIRPFMPINDYYVSVESSTYTINYPTDISIRKKEKFLETIDVVKDEKAGKLFYTAKNLEAVKPESYSPLLRNSVPKVLVALNEFSLKGVASKASNWEEFGAWMYNDLIKNTQDLPEATINVIQDLVKDETSDIEKAKKVYQFVQDKTRYISVQMGIGGWKPYNASEVDKLGYGDCKGLTAYTMSLLKAVGVESNYCIVYAGDNIKSLEEDFASIQGNHAFLHIPNGEENIWLECTNQKVPFGFIADFTDNRDVLVVKPDGGEIVHTKKYTPEASLQKIDGSYTINNNGDIEVKTTVLSKGLQYSDKLWLHTAAERDLDKHYKDRWGYINAISIDKMTINNDRDTIVLTENINFNATNYTKVIGDRMIFTVNALNRFTSIPDRYRNRKAPLKIERGFKDIDEVEITLPSNFTVEALPENQLIETKFGRYKTEIKVKNENTLVYKREFLVNDGEFPKEDYSKFRDFYKTVSRQDHTKIALIKKQE